MTRNTGLIVPLLALGLSGCAVVDQYSSRAVTYNLEAEETLDQGLLLNIVRASRRWPMQFTTIGTITGTASASGTASGGYANTHQTPYISLFGPPAPAAVAASTNTAISRLVGATGGASGTISGGQTFGIPVLDTQEFYQGVMAPVSGQLFDFYIQQEYPREEILTLFVEKILISKQSPDCIPPGRKSHTLECELTFVNSANSDVDFDLFESLVEHLLNLGLTTEPVESPQAGAQKTASNCGDKSTGSGAGQQCPTPSPVFRFCFSPRFSRARAEVLDKALCTTAGGAPTGRTGQSSGTTTTTTTTTKSPTDADGVSSQTTTVTVKADTSPEVGGQIAKKTTINSIRLSPSFIHNLIEVAETANRAFPSSNSVEFRQFRTNLPHFAGSTIVFTFYTRSTEGILYYLGQVLRHQLATDRIYRIKTEKSFVAREFSERPCYVDEQDPDFENRPFICDNFFVLDTGSALEPSPLSVTYDGERYAVPGDRKQAGNTMHILSIVKQLLAVNTSAKSLPQTSALSVINP
jgi:hypothetical protein